MSKIFGTGQSQVSLETKKMAQMIRSIKSKED
jgi:hypothetical protein